jgi:hypothetical protein
MRVSGRSMPAEETSSIHSPLIGSSTSRTGADRVADRLAILDQEGRAVGAVGHDLHDRPFLAADLHAHELVAHLAERGHDGVGDAGFQALMPRDLDRGGFGGCCHAARNVSAMSVSAVKVWARRPSDQQKRRPSQAAFRRSESLSLAGI